MATTPVTTHDVNVSLDPEDNEVIREIALALWGIKEQMDIQWQATGYTAHDPVHALGEIADALRQVAAAINGIPREPM